MPEESLQLREPVPVQDLLPEAGWPWWAWALLVTGCLIIVLTTAIIIRRRKKTSHSSKIDPEAAYQRARNAIDQTLDTPPSEASVALSIALRQYLADVSDDPSLYETHQEFIARHSALHGIPLPLREKTANLLTRLAEQKYNRSPLASVADLADESRHLLDELHRRPAAA